MEMQPVLPYTCHMPHWMLISEDSRAKEPHLPSSPLCPHHTWTCPYPTSSLLLHQLSFFTAFLSPKRLQILLILNLPTTTSSVLASFQAQYTFVTQVGGGSFSRVDITRLRENNFQILWIAALLLLLDCRWDGGFGSLYSNLLMKQKTTFSEF